MDLTWPDPARFRVTFYTSLSYFFKKFKKKIAVGWALNFGLSITNTMPIYHQARR